MRSGRGIVSSDLDEGVAEGLQHPPAARWLQCGGLRGTGEHPQALESRSIPASWSGVGFPPEDIIFVQNIFAMPPLERHNSYVVPLARLLHRGQAYA